MLGELCLHFAKYEELIRKRIGMLIVVLNLVFLIFISVLSLVFIITRRELSRAEGAVMTMLYVGQVALSVIS